MTTPVEQHQTDLREYIRIARDRKFEIALVTVVLVAATIFFTFQQTPIYEGQAKVLVKPVQSASSTVSIPQQPNLDTERELILSQAVAQKVQADERVSIPVDVLLRNARVQVVTDTEVLVIKYDDPSPRTAARLANAFATAYIDFRSQQALDQFSAAALGAQRQIDDVQTDLGALNAEIDSATSTTDRNTLQAQRDSLVARLGVLQQRLSDLQSNASVAQAAAQTVQQAEVPTSPASPNKIRNAFLALFAGLALGVGFALLRERLDDRVKTRQEVERRLGAPVVAAVPRVASWRKQDDTQLVMRTDPKSPVSEAYRTLGTNIQYMGSQQPLKVIMVTSALGGDGKTTTSSNLAVVLAQSGKRVILVSADLRRPRVHRFFGLSNDYGLSTALSDPVGLPQVTRDPGVPNLRVVTGGPVPNDPAALLGSERAAEFIRSLREVSDFVIVDTPPVLAVADASILAPLVDGTLFVLDASRSSRSALSQARDQLEHAGANIIGAVYNNFDPSSSSSYPYYYYNYYSQYYGTDEQGVNGDRRKLKRLTRRSEHKAPKAGSSNGSAHDDFATMGQGAKRRP